MKELGCSKNEQLEGHQRKNCTKNWVLNIKFKKMVKNFFSIL